MRFLVTLITCVALLIGGCDDTPKTPVRLSEGAVMPSITVTDLDGATLNLDSQRGKLVVLHVWATWCPPCREELPGLDRLAKSLDPQRYTVIGLAIDEDVNLVREFNLKYHISFARHIDPEMKVANMLGVTATPETFLIGPDGKLVRRMIGDQPWDTPGMRQVLEQAYNGQRGKSGAYW
ncbi:MAG TPA: TlpA disulfide reductase family protein [Gammaproteobacteria bacterium]